MESPVDVPSEGGEVNDKQVATVRTAMPAAWASVVLFVVDRLGVNLSEQDLHVILVVAPVVTGVFYRVAREVEQRWPMVGRVLFGSSRTPSYEVSTGGGC